MKLQQLLRNLNHINVKIINKQGDELVSQYLEDGNIVNDVIDNNGNEINLDTQINSIIIVIE